MEGYHQLRLDEREQLYLLRQEGLGLRQIADRMKRSVSTISREIRRNSDKKLGYTPDRAHAKAVERERGHPLDKIREGTYEYRWVLGKLDEGWSPEQTAGRYKLTHEGETLSHETIYRFIYSEKQKALKLHLWLPRKRPKRHKRAAVRKPKRTIIPERIGIENRPPSANDRTAFGHWEADLVCFSGQTASVYHMVERKTRLGIAFLLDNRCPEPLAELLIKQLSRIPAQALKSITFDNGIEFQQHTKVRKALSIATFFCNPYSSWEKGTVENANGILRRYLPRSTDLSTLTQKELVDIRREMNKRPMKLLGFRTPLEAFKKELLQSSLSGGVALHT